MERGEAELGSLELLDPDALDVGRWTRDGADGADLWFAVLQRALHLCEVEPGPLALAGSLSAGVVESTCRSLLDEGWSFIAGETIAARIRKRKTHRILREIRRAAAGVNTAFRSVARCLATADVMASGELTRDGEPLTVGRLRSLIARQLAAFDLSQPDRNIIAPAEEGAIPHSLGTDERVIREGESLVVDLFPRGFAYVDCTRTFCVGTPDPALREAHHQVEEALRLAEKNARPDAFGFDVQEKICEHFRRLGWPTSLYQPGTERGYVHGLGHGLGLELHELPSFRRYVCEPEGRLEVGDVITLEPGLYEPSPAGTGWGVRLENTYVVTEDGLDNLTPLPVDLDPRAW
ncbi:MAG: aminopeptidase P family protein [Thermoanaerobaculia bacterium]|nr:aminopeptidase P family protein [Thermoanaerobaculia bacterium]